jgi:hypothetical protein
MLDFISYEGIDKAAYDQCVLSSPDFRVYALSWYLDSVTLKWDLLVLDDYKAVMPLPRRSKYGLSYVYTPPFVQQLGVFSSIQLSREEECRFYARAFSRYFLADYFAHASSRCDETPRIPRTNYLLRLDRSHAELSQGFNSNRRRILKKASGELAIDKIGDPELLLRKSREYPQSFELDRTSTTALERLVTKNTEAVSVWNAFHRDRWAGGLAWIRDQRRITYLFPVQNSLGKELQVHTFIIDSLIKDHENSGLVLDLEGSVIPGVATFYRSFGAEAEIYYYYKSRCYGLF